MKDSCEPPSQERAKAGRPARNYIQLCADIGCSLEDLPEAMDDRDRWREKVREIRARGATWWWWWWLPGPLWAEEGLAVMVPFLGQTGLFKIYSYYTWKHITEFELRIFTWSYNYLLRIIIRYMKPFNCLQTNVYYQIGIINWKRVVFANGLGDRSSIPGRVIPKTPKMVLDAALLNTQHYKIRIKGKVEQSR